MTINVLPNAAADLCGRAAPRRRHRSKASISELFHAEVVTRPELLYSCRFRLEIDATLIGEPPTPSPEVQEELSSLKNMWYDREDRDHVCNELRAFIRFEFNQKKLGSKAKQLFAGAGAGCSNLSEIYVEGIEFSDGIICFPKRISLSATVELSVNKPFRSDNDMSAWQRTNGTLVPGFGLYFAHDASWLNNLGQHLDGTTYCGLSKRAEFKYSIGKTRLIANNQGRPSRMQRLWTQLSFPFATETVAPRPRLVQV